MGSSIGSADWGRAGSRGLFRTAVLYLAATAAFAADPGAAPTVTVDLAHPRQTIVGFGAADAFYSGWLTAHPNKEQIYALLFSPQNLGASVLRVQNVYGHVQPAPNPFDPDTQEVVAKAALYRSVPVTVLMSSWSPPAALKASGAVSCVGDSQTEPGCTLSKLGGAFDYTGYAQYWYDSLAAYSTLGVKPAYISLQNEPDWTPKGYAGCRFDPSETPGGIYAGYAQALDATYAKLATLPDPPAIAGPEVVGLGYNGIENYLAALKQSELGAVAHHLYHGGDSASPDSFGAAMRQLVAAAPGKPLFQTEFDHSPGQAGAFNTARLIHNSMTIEEAGMYLYWSYFWPDANQLIYIDNPWERSKWQYPDTGYHINDYYYALQHFSRFVQPGYRRVPASIAGTDVLASAYYDAHSARLVLVLLNTSSSSAAPTLEFDFSWSGHGEVYRSTFSNSTERFAYLGSLGAGNQVTLPPQAVATVVIEGVGRPPRRGHAPGHVASGPPAH